jgi:hypothetical protein
MHHLHALLAVGHALALPGHLIRAIVFFLVGVIDLTIPQIIKLIANAIFGH